MFTVAEGGGFLIYALRCRPRRRRCSLLTSRGMVIAGPGHSTRDSDRELLRACRRGDPRAWGQLVERYERLVYSIPLSYRLSPADAADVTQLTFTFLVESLDSLHEDSRLAGWLSTVARRHTWRLLAGNRRRHPGEVDGQLEPEPATDSDHLERLERVRWLHEGIVRLQPRCQELLMALFFDPGEPSYAEVAERLDIPVGSIGPTRARCLEYLRRVLDEE